MWLLWNQYKFVARLESVEKTLSLHKCVWFKCLHKTRISCGFRKHHRRILWIKLIIAVWNTKEEPSIIDSPCFSCVINLMVVLLEFRFEHIFLHSLVMMGILTIFISSILSCPVYNHYWKAIDACGIAEHKSVIVKINPL